MRTDEPYRTALSSVLLPARRSYFRAQHPTQVPTAMLFRAKPYLPPTSRAMQAAQHLKAFCGNSLPIGVRIEAHRDVSVPMDLLDEYRSPVDCLPARRKDSRYSNLAIVALNARGLSVSGSLSSSAVSCQLIPSVFFSFPAHPHRQLAFVVAAGWCCTTFISNATLQPRRLLPHLEPANSGRRYYQTSVPHTR